MSDVGFGKLREAVDGDLAAEVERLDPHAGFTTSDVSRCLTFAAEAIEDSEDVSVTLEDSTVLDAAVRQSFGAAVSDAVREQNAAVANFATGLTDSEVVVSDAQALARLVGLVRPAGRILTFGGEMDGGKTNFAWLVAEVLSEFIPNLDIYSNIEKAKGLDYDTVHSFEEFDKKTIASKTEKLVILDEASSHMTGYSKDSHEVEEKMGPAIRKMAKRHCRVLYLGHDGKDVHPTVRSMPGSRFVFLQVQRDALGEPEEFTANIFEGVEERQGVGHIMTLRELPATSVDYDPDEETSWSW